MADSTDRDTLLRELADTVAALQDAPADAFGDRVALRDRRDGLRAALADATGGRTRASLEQELAGLERQLEQLHVTRPNVAAMGGAGEGNDGLPEAQRLAAQFDAGHGRDVMERRVARIRQALANLDDQSPGPR